MVKACRYSSKLEVTHEKEKEKMLEELVIDLHKDSVPDTFRNSLSCQGIL